MKIKPKLKNRKVFFPYVISILFLFVFFVAWINVFRVDGTTKDIF